MAEIFFLSFATYMVWYAIRHLRAEYRDNGGFLTHPYGNPANGETDAEYREPQPAPQKRPQRVHGSLDDQPAHVIEEITRRAFGNEPPRR